MKKIESKEDIKLFSDKMKEQLSGVFDYDDCAPDEDSNLAFELYNDDDDYICKLRDLKDYEDESPEGSLNDLEEGSTWFEPDFINPKSIVVDGIMHNYGVELNKDTSDEELDILINRVINKYNELVDKKTEN